MTERLETVDDIVEKYAVVNSPIKSRIYVSLGSIFVIFSFFSVVLKEYEILFVLFKLANWWRRIYLSKNTKF